MSMADVEREQDRIASDLIVQEHLQVAEENTAEAPKPLSWTEIEYRVNQLLQDAYAFATGKLIKEREKGIKDYLGEKHGALQERQGRSSVVLTEVRDTIEWIKPALLKIFTQTGELGRMEPNGPEDEEQAQQRTDYANYVFFRDNPGFMVLYNAITDSLMQKVGWIKTYWDPSAKVTREEYTGLTFEQVQHLDANDEYGILEAEEYVGQIDVPDPFTGQPVPQEVTLYNLTVHHTQDDGRIRIECVPPEEVRINRDARSTQDAILVQHRREMMESELVELGYDAEMVRRLPSDDSGEFDEEEIARETVDDEPSFSTEARVGSTRVLHISEIYCRIDADGDGVAEWLCVWMAGDSHGKIFDAYPVDGHPFSSICPIPMPHRVYGLSVADLVEDLQVIKSTVLRQILDGLYLGNNPRWKVKRGGNVNYDQLLRNVPGGPIEVKEMDALEPIANPYNAADAGLPVLDFLSTVGEKRTGVSSVYTAVDIDSLDKTAFAASQKMGQAMSRVEMIGRIYAETGICEVFQKIDELAMKHQKVERTIRLRGTWQNVDPTSWEHKMDATVNVGIGSGSREVMAMNLVQMSTLLERIAGAVPGWVGPEQIYNLFAKISENLGFKNASQFLPDPTRPDFQLPEGEPSPEDKKLQLEAMDIQLKHEREVAALQIEAAKDERAHAIDLMEVRLRGAELVEKFTEEKRLRRAD